MTAETEEEVTLRSSRFTCGDCGRRYGIDDYPRNPTCPSCGSMHVGRDECQDPPIEELEVWPTEEEVSRPEPSLRALVDGLPDRLAGRDRGGKALITEGMTDDEGVFVPWKLCPPGRLVAEIIRLRTALAEAQTDSERLDWLEAQGNGDGWVARQSGTGRGFRLHNSRTHPNVKKTALEAIDASRQPDPAPGGTENDA